MDFMMVSKINCLGEILTEKSAKYDPHYLKQVILTKGKQKNPRSPGNGTLFLLTF